MLKVFESFAGIGTQRMGLERAGIDHEVFYKWCKDMSKDNIVLISGYHMPDVFEVVYKFAKAKSTMQGGHHESKYEKLFMVKDDR